MKLIYNRSTEPAFNLAADEVLLNAGGDYLVVWQNSPVVVVGRGQNTEKEVDEEVLRQNGIGLVRRSTGGGAVYHDGGNVNVSLIFTMRDGEEPVEEHWRILEKFLGTCGVRAFRTGRNDICTDAAGDSGKISGSAMLERRDRCLFHYTLLFDTDLELMDMVLTPDPEKLARHGTESVRARVVNLKTCSDEMASMNVDEFISRLYAFFKDEYGADESQMSPYEDKINQLAEERYRRDDWTLGRNP